jgi:hypothetical protein
MPSVFNKHHRDAPPDAVYIGRPSKWGNPFVVGRDGKRGECVVRYEGWIEANKELQAQIKSELRGKDLVCFCKPHPCHGDILLRIANSD